MVVPASPRQLAFKLDHSESLAREDFVESPSNAAAANLIGRWPDWPDRIVALVGPPDSGKSHLAAIWAEQSGARFLSARALDIGKLPAALATGALVVENVAEQGIEERALFHLINLARENGAFLLLTARSAPAQWAIATQDLASRLRAVPVVTLMPPDDALLRAVLVKLFADRQLAVDEALVGYLVSRIERSLRAAQNVVAALDREALHRKRQVNRALAVDMFRDRCP
jgi:chromosomal replication initiation ATPase DnaA